MENIIVNDNFKTKQISTDTISKSSENYILGSNRSDKEQISMILDDLQYFEVVPGGYHSFGNYKFNLEQPDPEDAINGSWSRYSSVVANCNVGLPPEESGVKDQGVMINDTSTGAIAYYYKNFTTEEQNQIKETGIGECEFTIAVPPIKVDRDSPYRFSNINNIDTEWFKNPSNKFGNQHSFVAFGAYDSSNPLLQFRFALMFRAKWENNSWSVYVGKSFEEASSANTKIPNWDGFSFRTFVCKYEPRIDNVIIATLYIKEGNTLSLICDDIIATVDPVATYKNSVQFGSYKTSTFASMVMKEIDFKAFIRNEYSFKYNGQLFKNQDELLDFCVEKYKFNIVGTGNADVQWFWTTDKNNINDLSTGFITFDKSRFNDNMLELKYFIKKSKPIKIFANKGSITKFINSSKNIANIDVTQLTNLNELDLSNNKLKSLDLSNNDKLIKINVSNNSINEIILNKNILSTLKELNVSNTFIKRLEFFNDKSTQVELDIIANDMSKLEYLILRGIKLTNPNIFVDNIFESIKDIDISESNLISSKTRLEKFLNNLPDRTNKTTGNIFLYGTKFTSNGVQGSSDDIKSTLESLKNKNWIFYL